MYGETDTEGAALKAAHSIREPRVRHFYDAQKVVGRAIARSLGGDGQIAWDIYLFYETGVTWQQRPPEPVAWAHQLAACDWADTAHRRCGEDLLKELRRVMDNLTASS